jgi:hypothetical protein
MGAAQQVPVAKARRAVTWKSLLAGALGSGAIGLGDPYGIHVVRGSYMALDFSTAGAIFLLFVLVFFVNRALARIRPGSELSQGELITAYVMMICACAVSTMGLASQLLPIITAPSYYATPGNGWANLIQPHINPALAPQGQQAIKGFYEGLPAGAAIPWGAWARPLAAWLPFLAALYLVMICIAILLRKQWADRERLNYPLTQVPLALVQREASAARPLLRNLLLWLGFAVPFGIGTLTALHTYYPSIPALTIVQYIPIMKPPSKIILRLSFAMAGFFYLVNLDVLFSLWFFSLIFQSASWTMNYFGHRWEENMGIYGAVDPMFKHLGMGAMIALVAFGLWMAREHLGAVVRQALGIRRGAEDSGEILSYRTAFWCLVLGLIVMAVWLHWSGIPWRVLVPFLALAFVLFVGLTRVVVETGLAEGVAASFAPGSVVSWFGTYAFGPSGLTALGLSYVWCSDIRTFVLASAAHGLKLADFRGESKRGLLWAMLIGIAVGAGCAIWVTLVLAYRHGAVTLDQWFMVEGPQWPYRWVEQKIRDPSNPHQAGRLVGGIGAAVMLAMMMLRISYSWWPLHPMGFAVGSVWIMDELWFTCALTWLLKWLIVRWGGLRTYAALRPVFLGLILGQFVCAGLWLIIDAFTGMRQNMVFWI